jgi:hypothetical protein
MTHPTILQFPKTAPDDPKDIRRTAAWWGTRALVSLQKFYLALEDGNARDAAVYQDRAVRFAMYAGTCARLAEGR